MASTHSTPPHGADRAPADRRLDWLDRAARGEAGATSVRAHLIPLALSAVLLALAFPHPGWGWLAHVALVPAALVAVRSARPRRLAWGAMLVFFVWWMVMLRWLVPVTGGGYALLAVFMALWPTAALLTLRWLSLRWKLVAVVALPVAWVSFEVLRDHVPAGGFGWFMLGYSQAPAGPGDGVGRLVQVADLIGVYGVSLIVAMTNGLIVDVLTRPLMQRNAHGRPRPQHAMLLGALIWLAAIIGAWGYGQYRITEHAQVTRPGPVLTLVQTNVPQDNKNAPTPESQQRDWQRLLELTHQASREAAAQNAPPALIVWPETVVPAGLNAEARARMADGPVYHQAVGELARELDVSLLIGAHAYEDFQPQELAGGQRFDVPRRRYNSAYLYAPDGRQVGQRYDKVHRVPFGEYVPWVEAVPGLKDLFIRYLTPYEHDYTLDAGARFTAFELAGDAGAEGTLRFATPICFEDAVGRVGRRMVYGPGGTKRVEALLNLTNDGWFAGDAMRTQHVQIAALRTIENRVPMTRSVNTGHTGFIDSLGRVGPVVENEHGQRSEVAGTTHASLELDDRRTLYGRVGEWPAWGVVILGAGLVLGGWRRGAVRSKLAEADVS